MTQRFPSLQQLGEDLKQLSERNPAGSRDHWRPGFVDQGLRVRLTKGLWLVSTAVLAAAIALVVVITTNGGPRQAAPTLTHAEAALASEYTILTSPQSAAARAGAASGPARALNRAIFDYPVLAGPQSPGAGGGTGPAKFLTGITGLNLYGSEGSRHFHVRTVGWAPYRNIPTLTREVTVDGVRVWFFVVYHPLTRNLPTAIVTGNWRARARQYTTQSYLKGLRREVNSTVGYQLWVRVGDEGTPQPIAPRRVLAARVNRAAILGHPVPANAGLAEYISTETATLDGPHGTIVAIVPRNVARLSWIWPRDFESSTLSFLPRLTESATATDNVAVLKAPRRYTTGGEFSPETVIYYRANGSVLARYTDPQNNTLQSEHTFETRSSPAPETVLSRRAERDPSTPNRVLVLPSVTKLKAFKIPGRHKTFYELNPSPIIVFNALLNHRDYYAHVTGNSRPGCIINSPSRLVEKTENRLAAFFNRPGSHENVRGAPYTHLIVDINCKGTYRISVSVLNANGMPYKPFATAKLTVR
jgi:hypothetical protein